MVLCCSSSDATRLPVVCNSTWLCMDCCGIHVYVIVAHKNKCIVFLSIAAHNIVQLAASVFAGTRYACLCAVLWQCYLHLVNVLCLELDTHCHWHVDGGQHEHVLIGCPRGCGQQL